MALLRKVNSYSTDGIPTRENIVWASQQAKNLYEDFIILYQIDKEEHMVHIKPTATESSINKADKLLKDCYERRYTFPVCITIE